MVLQWYSFQSLSNEQLYDILALRCQVFICEQNCIYQDIDNLDNVAMHLILQEDNKLIGYLRLFPAGTEDKDHIVIGRIVNAPTYRGKGIGKQLIQASIDYCKETDPKKPIKIEAQSHLESYYNQFGFQAISEPYDEDGILHTTMIISPVEN